MKELKLVNILNILFYKEAIINKKQDYFADFDCAF